MVKPTLRIYIRFHMLLILPIFFFLFPVLFGPFQLNAEEGYTWAVRENFRIYENGIYRGLMNRQGKGQFKATPLKEALSVAGEYYLLGETRRDNKPVAAKVEAVVPVAYTINPEGKIHQEEGGAFPLLRGFPIIPENKKPLQEKSAWTDYATYAAEPLGDGNVLLLSVYIRYRVLGETVSMGKKGHSLAADYAIRYDQARDMEGVQFFRGQNEPSSDAASGYPLKDSLTHIRGRHEASLFLAEDGSQFIKIDVQEEYSFNEGPSITKKGFVLIWKDVSLPMDKKKVAKDVGGDPEVTVEEDPRGLRVVLKNIHFYPNTTTILPEDLPKLKKMAAQLLQIPERSFLVEGHTADIGTAESQLVLSEARAKRVGEIFVEAGIEPDRVMYKGYGGKKPVAPNDTEENMALNRRVEIIILE